MRRSLTKADKRLFAVTFAGTVTANIVTVVAVTLAIIAARSPLVQKPNGGLALGGSLSALQQFADRVFVRHGARRIGRVESATVSRLPLPAFSSMPSADPGARVAPLPPGSSRRCYTPSRLLSQRTAPSACRLFDLLLQVMPPGHLAGEMRAGHAAGLNSPRT